jgi:hypothetical protein
MSQSAVLLLFATILVLAVTLSSAIAAGPQTLVFLALISAVGVLVGMFMPRRAPPR